jgi:hypothetical protein
VPTEREEKNVRVVARWRGCPLIPNHQDTITRGNE